MSAEPIARDVVAEGHVFHDFGTGYDRERFLFEVAVDELERIPNVTTMRVALGPDLPLVTINGIAHANLQPESRHDQSVTHYVLQTDDGDWFVPVGDRVYLDAMQSRGHLIIPGESKPAVV